jgi:hypothetical protein
MNPWYKKVDFVLKKEGDYKLTLLGIDKDFVVEIHDLISRHTITTKFAKFTQAASFLYDFKNT